LIVERVGTGGPLSGGFAVVGLTEHGEL